jgi:hypothetical protein
MTAIQERLVNAYVVLVMAGRKKLSDVPVELQNKVEIRIAEKTINILS